LAVLLLLLLLLLDTMVSAPSDPVKLIVVGLGQRARAYCKFIDQEYEQAKVVAVAEPTQARRDNFARQFSVPEDACFKDYKDIAAMGPKAFGADAVLICTQDRMHKECVLAFAPLNYHILCEKPMAPHLEDCKAMYDAVRKSGQIFGMGHVLRYSPHNRTLKKLLDDKVVGDIITINHVEPVGHTHFAHSFVRGNWGREADSSFALLAKSCHDIDILQYFMQSTSTNDHKTLPVAVQSFGSLTHFKRSNKPAEAGDATKCTACDYERTCPYSAKKIYIDSFEGSGAGGWGFWRVISDVEELASIRHSLATTNYGTCVYELDNDVCDNQIVNLTYNTPYGQATVAFTMIAFSTAQCVRKTTIYGSNGELNADGEDKITVHDFRTDKITEYEVPQIKEAGGSHGGGDFGLFRSFLEAIGGVKRGESVDAMQLEHIGCTPLDVFKSHEIVFDAEKSRRQGKVITLS